LRDHGMRNVVYGTTGWNWNMQDRRMKQAYLENEEQFKIFMFSAPSVMAVNLQVFLHLSANAEYFMNLFPRNFCLQFCCKHCHFLLVVTNQILMYIGLGLPNLLGSRGLRPQDISAPRHFGTNFKPNHRWSCVLSELSWVESVPTFRRSDAEVSRTTFLVQKCLETVLKCLMRVRSVLVPKCLVTYNLSRIGQYNCLQCRFRREAVFFYCS